MKLLWPAAAFIAAGMIDKSPLWLIAGLYLAWLEISEVK